MQKDVFKSFFLFILFLSILLCIGITFYFLSFDTYKKLLIKELTIPQIKIENSSKETFLKIFSKNGEIIYFKYNFFGGLINIDKDFENFNFFKKKLEQILGYDPILYRYWESYLKENKPFLINQKIEKFLENGFYQELLGKYNIKFLYEKALNDYKFSDGTVGVNGYSIKYFGKQFKLLGLKEKVFISLCAVMNLSDIKKHYSYLTKMTSLILQKREIKITFQSPTYINKYSEYTDEVFSELQKLGVDLKNHSYVVYSNFDKNLYFSLKRIIKNGLKNYKGIETGFVLIDYKNNLIDAIVGGIGGKRKINRAVKVKREVGSVFKPVTYLTAFANGFRPSFVLEDKKYKFYDGKRIYYPKNFKDYYMGKTNIRNGLIYSLNNLTVKLATKVGLKKVSNMANKLGFKNVQPFYAMPLGSIPQAPIDVARAYSVIANYGQKCEIKGINAVYEDGKKLEFDKDCIRVVDERSAYQVLYLMKKVVRYGTARGKGLIPGTAGKTGTSNNSKDCWFVAIFSPYVAVLWVGYDDFRVISEDATGGKVAAPVVAEIEKFLLKNVKKVSFEVPKGVIMKKVVKNHDLLYRNGCGRYYFEMLKNDNLPPVCKTGGGK